MILPPSAPRFLALLLLLPVLPLLGPLPEKLQNPPTAHGILLDRHGQELTHFPREDYFRHQPASLEDIPGHLVKATLAAEDKRFFEHPGIDYLASVRALYENARSSRITSGASTITQQLIKISTPQETRTLGKKLSEMALARRIETRWSKDQILTAYLNRLDYGSHRQGCAEAARFFFKKPLADLSLAESALLAGLPQAPSRLNPLRNPQAALERRNWILDRLASQFFYSAPEIELAKSEPLQLATPGTENPIPHLTNHFNEGAKLSIDSDLQRKTHDILEDELSKLDQKNVQHGAIVIIENATGEILAFHGSSDFGSPNSGQINGALALRSAGSTLKPFTYALAFQNQGLYPGTIIADVPTDYQTEEGLDAPKNYDRRHHGPVSIRHALGCSLNVSAMRMLNQLGGPEPLHTLLNELDLKLSREAAEYGLGLTIGNAEVSLLSLTNAYATLARLGEHFPPSLIHETKASTTYPLTREACFLIADILSDNQARAEAFGNDSILRLPFPCAVKTGTSSDFRDNWCVGFTADFTVGVWVGNFDNTPMAGISGVTGAGPIFHRAMLALHQDTRPAFPSPPNSLTSITVDERTGHHFPLSPSEGTPYQKLEFCPKEQLPLPVSNQDYHPDKRALLSLAYANWYQSDDNVKSHAFALSDSRPVATLNLKFLTPLPGATYYLDPELPGTTDQLKLIANLPEVTWTSDTLSIAGGQATLTPGTHRLQLTHPETKQTISCEFKVEEL
ncbi:MAG: penicillin-binding protein 1C [Akkermansiaceae bacterium]